MEWNLPRGVFEFASRDPALSHQVKLREWKVCGTLLKASFLAVPNGSRHVCRRRGFAAAAPLGQADRGRGRRMDGDGQPHPAALGPLKAGRSSCAAVEWRSASRMTQGARCSWSASVQASLYNFGRRGEA